MELADLPIVPLFRVFETLGRFRESPFLLLDLFLVCPKLVKPAKQFLEDLVVTFLQANSLVDMAQLQLGLAGSEVEFLEPVGRVADQLAGFVVFLAVAFELSELAEKFVMIPKRVSDPSAEIRLKDNQWSRK